MRRTLRLRERFLRPTAGPGGDGLGGDVVEHVVRASKDNLFALVPKGRGAVRRERIWDAPVHQGPKYPDPRTAPKELAAWTETSPDEDQQRPSIFDAVNSGDSEAVRIALEWEWMERSANGLSERWDPSASLSPGSINEYKMRDVWVGTDPGLMPGDSAAASSTVLAKCTMSALGLAALRGDVAAARALLQHPRCDVNRDVVFSRWLEGREAPVRFTPLFVAVARGDDALVEALCKHPLADGRVGRSADQSAGVTGMSAAEAAEMQVAAGALSQKSLAAVAAAKPHRAKKPTSLAEMREYDWNEHRSQAHWARCAAFQRLSTLGINAPISHSAPFGSFGSPRPHQ
eukprot:TRINITY_DN21664_c0_g1_i1.p1 TRINITY_DN21664_c0_g1~~TRINITY_DN21664_c0_g1_i1.p1  ORF type:complete len:345 (+),score=80.96 TRINITY_DN21664_c0_g1_i1:61-1095(+)